MQKYLIIIIFLFGIIIVINPAKAATEFISTIQQTGGDYSTLSSWEGAVQSDLTATTTRVFTGTGTGQLSNGDTVTCISGGIHNGITARVVATTTTQILLDNATSSEDVVLTDGDQWMKNNDDKWNVSGTGDELGDMSIAIAKIDGAWTEADETAVSITGWSTGLSNYIRIYTTEAARHNGKWDTGAYRMQAGIQGPFLDIGESNVKIIGLQFRLTHIHPNGVIYTNSVQTGVLIDKCIVRGWSDLSYGIVIMSSSDGSEWTIRNTIIYNVAGGAGIESYYSTGSDIKVYNSVIYGCETGILDNQSTITAKNCAVFNNTNDFSTGGAIDYCASDDGDGDHSVQPSDWSNVFVDYTNYDFHLKAGDTDLKNAGTNLYSEGITDDIDGDTRPASNWDIGADEEMTAVEFVSTIMEGTVGDYHSLSEWEAAVDCDLTASSTRVYSFDAPSGWVSDGVSVSTDSGASTATLIHAASSSQALLIDIQGSFDDNDVVTDGSNDFTLSNNGAPAIATAKIDGAWIQPDTTAVTITDWTTSATNYIKIYTTDTARHNGKWDTNKYRLEITTSGIRIYEDYVRINGLQIKVTCEDAGIRGITVITVTADNNAIYLGYNIVIGVLSGNASSAVGIHGGDGIVYVYNNLIYDWEDPTYNHDIRGIKGDGMVYAYSNTIVNCHYGIRTSTDNAILAKNNLISGSLGCSTLGTFANGTDYNADDTGTLYYTVTGGGNTHDRESQAFLFVDEANDDFHLAGSDTAARDAGTDLSGDSNLAFDDDIDGEDRGAGGAWDIGADEKKRATVINAPLTNKLTDGLVGHWTFNGQDMDWASTTAEALDRSGNSNNGNVVNFGLEGATDGISGQALEFDGSVDVVNCGTDDSLNNISTLTVTAWVYPTGWGGSDWGRIISKGDTSAKTLFVRGSGTNTEALSFWHDFSSSNGMWNTGDYTLSLNQWQHVAVTFDNSSDQHVPKIYIDGVGQTTYEIDAPSGTAVLDGSYDLLVGNNANDDRAFVGIIDEVRIYNYALATSTIQDLYQAGARRLTANAPMTQKQTGGLVGSWTFNGQDMDWGSNTAYDRSGQGNDGTMTNMSTSTSPTDGQVGQALEFDGSDDYVEVDPSSSINDIFDNGGTVLAWIYINTYGANDMVYVVNKYAASTGDWQFWIRDDGATAVEYDTLQFSNDFDETQGYWQAWDVLSTGNWLHIAVTYDNSLTTNNPVLYVNGAFVTIDYEQTPVGSDESDAAHSLIIGARNTDALRNFDGLIDEVRVYDRALATSTIQDLYQAGARRFKLK